MALHVFTPFWHTVIVSEPTERAEIVNDVLFVAEKLFPELKQDCPVRMLYWEFA